MWRATAVVYKEETDIMWRWTSSFLFGEHNDAPSIRDTTRVT